MTAAEIAQLFATLDPRVADRARELVAERHGIAATLADAQQAARDAVAERLPRGVLTPSARDRGRAGVAEARGELEKYRRIDAVDTKGNL